MAVTAIGSGSLSGGSATITTTLGTNSVLVIFVSLHNNDINNLKYATFNGKAMGEFGHYGNATFGASSGAGVQVFVLPNYDVGAYTFALTGGGSQNYVAIQVDGVDFDNLIDGRNVNRVPNSATPTSPDITTTVNNTIAVNFTMAYIGSDQTMTQGSGWTKLGEYYFGSASDNVGIQYQVVGSPATTSNSYMTVSGSSTSTDWLFVTIGFRAGAGFPTGNAIESNASKNMKASKRRYRP